ncbi:MAG TPA: DedA family protein [Candidatus Woesebacteria bacterium]|nr:DedA family protein [Candidatus Woesebacteria bacterium]
MEIIKNIIDFILHVDKYLAQIVANFGAWTYAILFGVIFIETGLVVMPFLPGDSLLFAAGAFSAMGAFNLWLLYGLMILAAFLGDTANYWIGHAIGSKAFDPNFQFSIFNFKIRISKILKPEYLEKAQSFYEKHGGKAIVLARFVPIVRTFAPFVAGVSKMTYGHFLSYNLMGGILWVSITVFSGFFFGNIPMVKENFEIVIVAIVLISVLPMVFEYLKAKRENGGKKKIN